MKKMVCELCGGTDFIKKDGLFECQTCGMKYSLEEAKKLFQEVNDLDDKESTVQEETSFLSEQEYQNLVKNADATYMAGDYETAYHLYTNTLNIKPEDTHCIMRRALSALMQTTPFNDRTVEFIREVKRAFGLKYAVEKGNRFFFRFCAMSFYETEASFRCIAQRFSGLNMQIYSAKMANLARICLHVIQESINITPDFSNSDEDFWNGIHDLFTLAKQIVMSYSKKPNYDYEEYEKGIKNLEKTAKEQIAMRRERNLTAYWSRHEKEKLEIERHKQEIRNEIVILEESKSSIAEQKEIDDITEELHTIEGKLKQLKTFDMKGKKLLKDQQGILWDKRRDARARAAKHIEKIDELISAQNHIIDLLNAELTLDRWPDEEETNSPK